MRTNRIVWIRAMMLLTAAAFLGSGCHNLPVGDRIVVISGRVMDKETQKPADSAWVSLYDSLKGPLVYTDSTGAFFTSGYPIFRAGLFAGKNGFHTSSKLLENINHDTSGIVFELIRSVRAAPAERQRPPSRSA